MGDTNKLPIRVYVCNRCSCDEPCRAVVIDGLTPEECVYSPILLPTWQSEDPIILTDLLNG